MKASAAFGAHTSPKTPGLTRMARALLHLRPKRVGGSALPLRAPESAKTLIPFRLADALPPSLFSLRDIRG